MPEGLQDSESGTLLEERAEACENISTELDDVDLDYDEPDEDEIRAEIREDAEEETEENIEARKQAKLEEWLTEKVSELEGVSWDYN